MKEAELEEELDACIDKIEAEKKRKAKKDRVV